MRPLLATFRAVRIVLHILVGLVLAVAVRLDPTRRLDPEPLSQWWSRHLLRLLGIRLVVKGRTPRRGQLIVANHVSWLDIFAILALHPTRFVAKAEIRDWPIAGWLANAVGTFYIRRGKGGARPLLEKLEPFLAQGGSVVVFPEGTTTDGQQVLPFHSRLFSAASASGAAIQPVALRYSRDDRGRDLAPFIGDDDLVRHILRLLAARGMVIEMHVLPAITETRDVPRDELAMDAWQAVATALRVHAETVVTDAQPANEDWDDAPAQTFRS